MDCGRLTRTGAGSLRQRLLVSLALAVLVAIVAMAPAVQFPNWQWAALASALHGAPAMDISIPAGATAACGRYIRCAPAPSTASPAAV